MTRSTVTLLEESVLTAARSRILTAFDNGVPVYMSLSGGKDSIVLASLTYDLLRSEQISPEQLHVIFIDEEAIYDSVERIVLDWRSRFMLAGVDFRWYCLQVMHFNCFNRLTNDESFICWDALARDRWVRPMPPFAITWHPLLREREENYQHFLPKVCADGIMMTGVRNAESLQRAAKFSQTYHPGRLFNPLYDWKDPDVWRYIRDRSLDFPETYMRLYQTGATRREMRLSQFFSIDTARSLVKMDQHEPGLMDRITRREPNAYLAALYWDSEMFRSAGGDRQGDQRKHPDGYWRSHCLAMLNSPQMTTDPERIRLCKQGRTLVLRFAPVMKEEDFRDLYSILIGGDPKNRTFRALLTTVKGRRRDD